VNRKINVLQFPIGNTKGGITRYVMTNWKFIDKDKFQFDFATMSSRLDFEKEILKAGRSVYHINTYAEMDPKKFKDDFCKMLDNGKYDIVHLHTGRWKSTLAEEACKEMGIRKIIIHAHSTGVVSEDVKEREKNLARHSEIVKKLTISENIECWACSKAAAKFLFGDSITEDKVHIMLNAIDLETYSYKSQVRENVRKNMGWEGKYVIGHVGRFAYPKNQEFLLRIMPKLIECIPNIKLVLVGDGVNLEKCREYVSQHALNDYVTFTGYRTDAEKLLQGFDVFTLPSEYEGVSLALLEAQAAGLLCYASDCMPKDVGVTNSIKFLPLEKEMWCSHVLEDYRAHRSRANNIEMIRNAGYDIREQIKNVERGYMGEY